MANGSTSDRDGNPRAAGAPPTNGDRSSAGTAIPETAVPGVAPPGVAPPGAGIRGAAASGSATSSRASAGETADGRFRGVTELSLDSKGRLAIPARHREGLVDGSGGELVITADPGGCLLIFPRLAWEPLQQQLMGFSSFNETVRRLQRLLVGHADDVEIDAAGRILVPPALRRYAGLDKHVVLVGQGRKLELWDAARWQAQTAQAIALPAELPSDLAGFSL